ncbi:hypothetical protein [Haladaptatus sp. NG-WS-4]
MLPTDTTQIKQFESHTNGVTVEKTLSISDDAIGVVTIAIDSTHDDPVTVRVTDRLPTGFDSDRIGFRPEDTDHWTVSDEAVVFESSVPMTGDVETLYGINEIDKPELRRFVDNPAVTVEFDEEDVEDTVLSDDPVDAPDGSTATEPPSDSTTSEESFLDETVLDTLLADEPVETSDDSTVRPTTDDRPFETPSAGDGSDETILTSSTTETQVDSESGVSETTPATEMPLGPEAVLSSSPVDGESHDVVGALVTALEQGSLTDHERTVLDEHSGQDDATSEEPPNGSVVARLRHVETTVNELEAYTAALESFLDETGDANEMLNKLEET